LNDLLPSRKETLRQDSDLIKFFLLDAKKAVNVLEDMSDKMNNVGDSELKSYIVIVHGMKSALANIGEDELSKAALKLELAGRERNFAVMSGGTPVFIDALRSIIEKLKPENDNDVELSNEDLAFLQEKLHSIKTACMTFNNALVKAELNALRQKVWPKNIDTVLEELAVHILHSKFNEAVASAEKIISVA